MLTDSYTPSPEMHRFTVEQLQNTTRGQLVGTAPTVMPLRRVVCDSRQVKIGDVFWALPGEHVDGAQFIGEAFDRGAWGCVLGDSTHAPAAREALEGASRDGGRFLLFVEDPVTALAQLAAWYRKQIDPTVVAVTGSVGKTTTRSMIHAALAPTLRGKQSPGNYNNRLGVSLSVLQLDHTDEYAVLELGASGAGEIAALAAIAQPHIGVLTRISAAHLEGFGSVEGVAIGKAELIEALPADGVAIVNGDDPWAYRIATQAPCRAVFVGEQGHNHWIAQEIEFAPGKLAFELFDCRKESGASHGALSRRGKGTRVEVPVTGRHHVTGILCAVAVGHEMGLSLEQILAGMAQFRMISQRCAVIDAGAFTLIDDSYNASPASLTAALAVLSDLPAPGRKIVVAGDMCELGTDSRALHRSSGAEIGRSADMLFAYGDFAQLVAQSAKQVGMPSEAIQPFTDMDEMIAALEQTIRSGDAVLVKGSRAMAMERVVERLSELEVRTMPAGMTQKPHTAEYPIRGTAATSRSQDGCV